jgi:DNA-binding NarL/FixJ family response regulator
MRKRSASNRRKQSPPLTIVIADDHGLVREALRQLFADHSELQVVGEATTGTEAIDLACALRPDVMVMDVAMPELDGIEATRRIHATLPEILIFGFSTRGRSPDPHPIEQAGAIGYFVKDEDSYRLLTELLETHARRHSPG